MTATKYLEIVDLFEKWMTNQHPHWKKFGHKLGIALNPRSYFRSVYVAGFQHGEYKAALGGTCLNCGAKFDLSNGGCMDLIRKETAALELRMTELGMMNSRLRQALNKIQAQCGIPDAADACRLILKTIDQAFNEVQQNWPEGKRVNAVAKGVAE